MVSDTFCPPGTIAVWHWLLVVGLLNGCEAAWFAKSLGSPSSKPEASANVNRQDDSVPHAHEVNCGADHAALSSAPNREKGKTVCAES
jgi:hypothetical protein